jgi:hypothetical protein
VEADEVRVGEVGEGAELVLEPIERGGVEVLQDLQRDEGAALAIVGLVDHARGAGAQAALELEPGARREVVFERARHLATPRQRVPEFRGAAKL